jgi:hypothetical protein
MLREAFAAGAQKAFVKFAVAGQPTLSSVGMAPPVTLGLPPAAKLTAHDLGMPGKVNSGGMPTTPSQVLPSVGAGAPRLNPPSLKPPMPKMAEDAKPELCTSCRKAKHYGPCTRETGTPGEGRPLTPAPEDFIRSKLRGT